MASHFEQMIRELKKCEAAGADIACVVLVYVYIYTLSYLAMPKERSKNTRRDFINWVDTYLKAEPSQPYQYKGIDLYAARCAVLHTHSAESEIHETTPGVVKFGYHDGGKHALDPALMPNLALIGIPSLIDDFVSAVETFLTHLRGITKDPIEKSVLESRLAKTLLVLPFKS